jgi:hypothetical protein
MLDEMSKYWKIPLAWLLHLVGHAASVLMHRFDWFWLYSPYQWCMMQSSDLDEWNIIWKPAPKDG